MTTDAWVLIPLNSGQLLCPMKVEACLLVNVLIPLNSGQLLCLLAEAEKMGCSMS